MRKDIQDWITSSDYDYETGEDMFKSGRYSYVIFMCHQCIEKLLKALIMHLKGSIPSRSHNLKMLLEETGLSTPDRIETTLMKLSPHYILSRYPNVAGGPPETIYNLTIAQEFMGETKEVREWLKGKLI